MRHVIQNTIIQFIILSFEVAMLQDLQCGVNLVGSALKFYGMKSLLRMCWYFCSMTLQKAMGVGVSAQVSSLACQLVDPGMKSDSGAANDV